MYIYFIKPKFYIQNFYLINKILKYICYIITNYMYIMYNNKFEEFSISNYLYQDIQKHNAQFYNINHICIHLYYQPNFYSHFVYFFFISYQYSFFHQNLSIIYQQFIFTIIFYQLFNTINIINMQYQFCFLIIINMNI